VIRASGEVALAMAIKKGDQMMTDRGVARVMSVGRIPYTGQVYNLTLGTSEEKAKVGKDGTTMFASGFLVGDNAMQQAYPAPRHQPVALSEDWKRDYRNAAAGNPPMKRVLR
jgi:hypothetical protein